MRCLKCGAERVEGQDHVCGNSVGTSDPPAVTVVDIRMPFDSMVTFMVKLALAALPAFFIILILYGFLGGIILRGIAALTGGH